MTEAVNLKTDKYDVKGCRTSTNKILDPPHWSCIGNPFHLKDVNNEKQRKEVIDLYREYFYSKIKRFPEFKDYILSLKGKRIGCFCKPLPCHLDIVVEYIESYYGTIS